MKPSGQDDPPSRREAMDQAEQLFFAALEQPTPAAREALLEARTHGDAALRARVSRLIQAHFDSAGFLEQPLPDKLAGDLGAGGSLSRWNLLESIGEGGLGIVYRAFREEDGVRVDAAVKVLRPGFDTGIFRDRFIRERQLLAGLDHPGIVRMLDCGADAEGRSFLAMEFVEGIPLDEYLKRSAPAPRQRLGLFEAVSEAVAYLHSRMISHGDLKPSNILVTRRGVPKLLDFGAAQLAGPEAGERGELTRLLMTPRYASPEQKRGEGPSALSDIYSLGRLLSEMLPEASADVALIAARCLAEDSRARYQSVAEILEDLRRSREGLPLRARPATMAYVARRFLARNWPVAAATFALLLSLAAGWWHADRQAELARRSAAEAGAQREAALRNAEMAKASRAEAETAIRQLNGLVNELLDERGGDPQTAGSQQKAIERSLRRAATLLEAMPGPERLLEKSIIWRRLAMIHMHRGEFTQALEPMAKARAAADAWLGREPGSAAARRNAVLTRLHEVRLMRERGNAKQARALAMEAYGAFVRLPAAAQAELDGTVWGETMRLAVARELVARGQMQAVPAMLERTVVNTEKSGEVQLRNSALFNLIYALRRLNRLPDASRWCRQAREWKVVSSRYKPFCTEPVTAFTARDPLFPGRGVLTDEGVVEAQGHIFQILKNLREDPESFDLNITLARAHMRLARHYFENEETELGRRSLELARQIHDKLNKRDPHSPIVANFSNRIARMERFAASGDDGQ